MTALARRWKLSSPSLPHHRSPGTAVGAGQGGSPPCASVDEAGPPVRALPMHLRDTREPHPVHCPIHRPSGQDVDSQGSERTVDARGAAMCLCPAVRARLASLPSSGGVPVIAIRDAVAIAVSGCTGGHGGSGCRLRRDPSESVAGTPFVDRPARAETAPSLVDRQRLHNHRDRRVVDRRADHDGPLHVHLCCLRHADSQRAGQGQHDGWSVE
jgi:hypothetical protein